MTAGELLDSDVNVSRATLYRKIENYYDGVKLRSLQLLSTPIDYYEGGKEKMSKALGIADKLTIRTANTIKKVCK